MRKLLLLVMGVMLSATALLAQRTVTGKVTDDKGAAVPNASVTVKGTNIDRYSYTKRRYLFFNSSC